MSGVRQLYIKLGMDTSGLSKGVGNAGVALGKLTKMAAVAGAAIGALAAKGVQASAKYEQMRMTFETLTGSVSKGRKLLEQFNQFAIKTPFETQDVNEAGLTLLNFGLETEKILPTLQRLGDLSKGNAQDFQTLARVYGQARVEGKLMSKDIREFVSANIPIVRLLAEQLGVAEDQIFNMASEGKISFGVLEKAFAKATEEGGLFHGMMDKQSKSAIGLWSTFKDKLNIALRQLGDLLLPAIKVGLENMTRIMDNVIGQMTTAAGETEWPYILAAGVQTFFDKLGDLFKRIYNGLGLLRSLYHASMAIGKAWEGVAAAMSGNMGKAGELFSESGNQFGKSWQGIKDFGRELGNVLGFETARSFGDVFKDNMSRSGLQASLDKFDNAYGDTMSAIDALSLSSPSGVTTTPSGGTGKGKSKPKDLSNAAGGLGFKKPLLDVGSSASLTAGIFSKLEIEASKAARATEVANENMEFFYDGINKSTPEAINNLYSLSNVLGMTEERSSRLMGIAQGIGDTFVSVFDQIIQGGFKFGEFMKQMFLDIVKQAMKALIVSLALKALTGGASTFGEIFKSVIGGGFLPKTASGGIVTGPQRRIVGEAGPEAILPLNRQSTRNMLGGGGTNRIVGSISSRQIHLMALRGQQDAFRTGSRTIQFG